MEEQKREIIEFVRSQKLKGATITESLKGLGVKRSTYYSWIGPQKDKPVKRRTMELTSEEKTAIEWTKEGHPEMRHRQLLGILQNGGLYLSFSSVYHHLKSLDMIEP